jgi:hypothetical protein
MTKASLRALPCLLALALAAAPAVRAGDDTRDPADPFPRRRFQPLPGKAVGVLVADGQEVLGREGRKSPADALCLGTGPGSYRMLYVPVDKKPIIGGLNVPVGEKGQSVKPFRNLSPASPKTVAKWGVTGPYALVEVEVNGGLGGPARENFVATNMRVLDGTKEYPLQVNRVVDDLRREVQVYLKAREDAVENGLTEARARVPAEYKVAPGREQAQTVFVTWLPETEQLRVTIHARIIQKAYGPVRAARPPLPTDDGTRPGQPASTDGLMLGVELGMTYEVSKRGVLDANHPVPLHTFQKAFAAPPPRQVAEAEAQTAPEK